MFMVFAGAMEVTLSSEAAVACSDSSNSQLKLSRKPRMSVVSDWVNKSAAGGRGGGEGNRWCKTGSKLNSKSAKGTGGESILTVVGVGEVGDGPDKTEQTRRRPRPTPPSMASEETEFDHLQSIPDQQQQGQQQQQQPQTPQQQQAGQTNQQQQDNTSAGGRKSPFLIPYLLTLANLISNVEGPSVRRACATCHAGKTRCSEVLPCQVRSHPLSTSYVSPEKRLLQSCLKRGLGATCAYPEPDNSEQPPGKLLPAYADS